MYLQFATTIDVKIIRIQVKSFRIFLILSMKFQCNLKYMLVVQAKEIQLSENGFAKGQYRFILYPTRRRTTLIRLR